MKPVSGNQQDLVLFLNYSEHFTGMLGIEINWVMQTVNN